jgi:predicted trehalose synthase
MPCVLLLEKAIYEVHYELNNRPDWIAIPALGLRRLLRRSERPDAHEADCGPILASS